MEIKMLKSIFKSVWTNTSDEQITQKKMNFSATKFRNYFMNDTLLDFLNVYGEKFGFQKDDKTECCYQEHIMQRGQEFEKYVMNFLTPKFKKMSFVNIGIKHTKFNEVGVSETITHMKSGTDVIYQGFLDNKELCIHGIPDLLIRVDKLRELFGFYPECDIRDTRSEKREFPHLYVVVDIKYSTVDFCKNGTISNNKLMMVYSAQLFVYNKILENLFFERTEIESPFFQPNVFLLSPRMKITDKIILDGKETISRIDLNNHVKKDFAGEVRKALNWLKEMHENGESWDILKPIRKELRPNMKNKEDYPWHSVKSVLAKQQKEISDRPGISYEASIEISEKRKTIEDHIGEIKNPKKRRLMEVMNEVQSDKSSDDDELEKIRIHPIISPSHDKMNFYVDFEFISGSEFSFEPNYRTHLYLIGMGYESNGKFKYERFILDTITDANERMIIQQWISRMRAISRNREFQLIHWSNAEPSFFNKLKESLQIRGIFNWQDLKNLFEDCPVLLKEHGGNIKNQKLKTVAKSMKRLGHIQSDWDDDMTNGIEANMVIIRGVQENLPKIIDFPGIEKLIHYNQIDCATLYEIVKYVQSKKRSF
jgi:hypothetical protein